MHKKTTKLQWLIVFMAASLLSAETLAQPPSQAVQLPPFLPSYQPPPAPPPNTQFVIAHKYAWLTNFYISGHVQYDFSAINNIDVVNPLPGQPSVAEPKSSKSIIGGGAALGYQFRPAGLFSRVEVEYTYRSIIHYSPNPLYQFPANYNPPPLSELNSQVRNQTLLAKIYYDINTNTLVMPYIQVGAGVAFNHVKARSQVNFAPPIQSAPVRLTATENATNLAWDVGAGLRLVFNRYVSAAIGYQFTSLGKLKWQTTTFDPNSPINLKSNKFYANGVTFNLMLHA